MQLEKTDGPTHPDETLGNDADAGKIPPPENNGPSACRFGTISTADHAPAMSMRGGAGKRSGAPMRRNPSIFFWTVRLKPHDRNRLHARATQSGLASGVLADAPAASATARPNGPKEKISGTDRNPRIRT